MSIKKQVSIAIPCAQVVEPKTLQSILAVVNYAARNGIEIVDIGVTEREMIDAARNNLASTFLQTPTEWVFWMDSDMVFQKETLVELFKVAEEKDAKMVTGVYYQRKGQNLPVLWSRDVPLSNGELAAAGDTKYKENKYLGAFTFPHKDKKEPFIVHAAGFGCFLVHRSVLEKMDPPYFRFMHQQCSEDFYFCIQAKELGYTLWAVPSMTLGHIGDAPIITKHTFWEKMKNSKQEIAEIEFEKVK